MQESSPTIGAAITADHLDSFLVGRRCFALPSPVDAWALFLEAQSRAGRPACDRARNANLSELKALRSLKSPQNKERGDWQPVTTREDVVDPGYVPPSGIGGALVDAPRVVCGVATLAAGFFSDSAVATLALLAWRTACIRRLGGITGDTAGALTETVEAAVLVAIVASGQDAIRGQYVLALPTPPKY